MHDDKLVGILDAEPPRQESYRLAGVVHERLWERNSDSVLADPQLRDKRSLLFRLRQLLAVASRKRGRRIGSDVVTSSVELSTRVAETDDL